MKMSQNGREVEQQLTQQLPNEVRDLVDKAISQTR